MKKNHEFIVEVKQPEGMETIWSPDPRGDDKDTMNLKSESCC